MGCMAADRINGQITVTKIDKARRSILVAGERSGLDLNAVPDLALTESSTDCGTQERAWRSPEARDT